nr:hypothetical protein [Bifidobacterium dentium]
MQLSGRDIYRFNGKVTRPTSVKSSDLASLDTLKVAAKELVKTADDGSLNYADASWNALQTELE